MHPGKEQISETDWATPDILTDMWVEGEKRTSGLTQRNSVLVKMPPTFLMILALIVANLLLTTARTS